MRYPTDAVQQAYDIRTLDLEVLTPVHVGGREGVLKSMEFLLHAGTVHVVDEDRFARWLQEQNLIDSFIEEAKTGTMDLARFVQKRPGWRQALPTWTRYAIKGGREGMQEFRPLIRDAHDRVYLPGTAIKGALRTAILWKRLYEGTPVRLEQVEAAVEYGIVKDRSNGRWRFFAPVSPHDPRKQRPVGKERFSQWLQHAVLGKDPHHDLLRCLTVRDAYPVGDTLATKVIPLIVLCKQRDGALTPSSKNIVLWVEAFMPGSRFRIELQWDRRQRMRPEWRPGPPNDHAPASLDEVLQAVQLHQRAVMEQERAFFEHSHGGLPQAPQAADQLAGWYAEAASQPLVRIGFGGGMVATTIDSLLEESTRQRIRNAAGHDRNGDPAPKSRRMWVGPDGRAYPMGWAYARPVGEGEPAGIVEEAARRAIMPAAVSTAPSAQVVRWARASCLWNAGQHMIEAVHRGEKAVSPRLPTEDDRRRLVAELPEDLRRRLIDKRKTVILDVDIEVQGNQKTIVAVHPPSG